MPKTEHPLQALTAYLPEDSFEHVVYYINHYKIHLTITRKRQTVLGDYRNALHGKNHRITVNGNLNKYSFLITLLHELAHLLAFEKFGNRIQAHGKEWKIIYSGILQSFTGKKIFPDDIEVALQQSIKNPGASSCAEVDLMRVLKRYDTKKQDVYLLEELSPKALFKTEDGRIFEKGERLRKRYRCIEKKTGLVYLFSSVHEVKLII